jgi:hypothetical protein
MPIVFATPRTQGRECLGTVISSADVERLQAALVLAREAGLPADGLEAALAGARALRAATAAAAAAIAGDGAALTTNLRNAINSFEALAAAHCTGRPASGRDLAAARKALSAATRRQQHQEKQASAAAAVSAAAAQQRPRPRTAGAVVGPQQNGTPSRGQVAFERWLAAKRAAEHGAAQRALEAQQQRDARRGQAMERRAAAAARRHARERGWPSSLVVETVVQRPQTAPG